MVKDENYWEEIYKSLLEEYHELETQLSQKEEEVKRLKAQISAQPRETGVIIEAHEETAPRAGAGHMAGSSVSGQPAPEHSPTARQSVNAAPTLPRPEIRAAAPSASLATIRPRLGMKRNFFQRTWSFFFDPILRI